MSCVVLVTEAHSATIDEASGLCVVCKQIYFYFVPRTANPCDNGHQDICRHFHICSLRHVFDKAAFCPGCRLILAAISSSVSQVNEARSIKVERDSIVHTARHDWSYSDGKERPYSIKRGEYYASPLELFIKVILEPERTGFSERVIGSIIRRESLEHNNFSEYFRGREVPVILGDGLLRDWIHRCDTQHKECLLLLNQRREFVIRSTIRLIDVKERKVILTTQPKQDYVALSYVWGEGTKGSLTTATIGRFSKSNGIPDDPDMIPQTILDAIRLVWNIGFRYLWVDSLCILQDNDGDKLRHLPHMDCIYSCASLVIIAAAGKDAYAGLPGVTRSRSAWQLSEVVGEVPFITAQPLLREALEGTAWNSRGWTFQEAILARRALIFTEHQVYWNCRMDCWREDMTCEMTAATIETNDGNSLWAKTLYQGACPTRIYCDRVTRFSCRRFKEDGDVLWAFTGVLKLEASQFPKGFIWGLPYEILDTALLWSVRHPCCRRRRRRRSTHNVQGTEGASYKLQFPSWSWLSQSAEITFLHSCKEYVVSKVSWHTPLLVGRDATPPTDLDNNHLDQQDSGLLSGHTQDWANVIMHYGFLRFMAQTAQLDIRKDTTNNQEAQYTDGRVDVKAHNSRGEKVGSLRIHDEFFEGKETRPGECVLLSANVKNTSDDVCKRQYSNGRGRINVPGNVDHVDGCAHVESYNIMLIEWDGEIARRVGLGTVEQKAWKSLDIRSKLIVLG